VPGRHRGFHEAAGQGAIELPAQWYCQGEPFQQERQKLFAAAWQLLGRASSLQQPGDYLCANLAGWPVFALVNSEGKLAAFRNVCRHQKMGVLEIGAGSCSELRCKYHGWSYDLDGRFASAPPLVAPAEPASPSNDLERIAVAIWCGFAFISLTGTGESPAGLLQAQLIDQKNFSGESTTDIGCNWKLYIEHCLAADPASWAWPALVVRAAPDGIEVQQVIPRTFNRTRVIQHYFGEAKRDLMAAKSACENAQKRAEAGELAAAPTPAVAAFRGRVLGA
jgi:nitrite reductase/ring-hydroxylating ferredoxin subunit